jgi:hypothetical protein
MPGAAPLRDLVCRSSTVCVGVLGPTGVLTTDQPTTPIVRTSDGGASWSTASVPVQGSLFALSCPTDQTCVALGHQGTFTGTSATGFVLRSNNGGQTWATGSLPQNFGVIPALSGLSCTDASHCMAIGGTIVPNPQQCEGTPPDVIPPPGHDSCDSSPTATVSAVAVSSDGGANWKMSPLPSTIPEPQLFSISCASATTCWSAGQEAVPLVIGNVHDNGSPVVAGTTDGGATWTKATFTIPAGAPNYLGQSYLGIGDISCPSTSTCLALGITAQGAPSTPIYRYEDTPASAAGRLS